MSRIKWSKYQEPIFYLSVWSLIFAAPVLSIYVRSVNESMPFDWSEVLMVWRKTAIFFAFFLLHNYLLAPLLVYRHRRTAYMAISAMLVVAFAAYECNNHPLGPGKGRRDMSDSSVATSSRSFDGHRPPAPAAKPPGTMEAKGHRPPAFSPDHRPPFDETLAPPPRPGEFGDRRPPLMFGQHDVVAVVMLLLMLAANLGVKLYFKQQHDQKRVDELERRSLEQQLEYLRYQINPHFLMNTLNNIHALVDIDAEKAKETIVGLSKIMRFMLYDGARQTVPLASEVAFLEDYIRLMQLRFSSDKVSVSFAKPEQLPQAEVPPLTFITFVENAFKHGVSYRQQSFVDVTFTTSPAPAAKPPGTVDATLTFVCRNSKIPSQEEKHGGVGLKNVKKRLDLIYGSNYTLTIDDGTEDYTVSLCIPL